MTGSASGSACTGRGSRIPLGYRAAGAGSRRARTRARELAPGSGRPIVMTSAPAVRLTALSAARSGGGPSGLGVVLAVRERQAFAEYGDPGLARGRAVRFGPGSSRV